jgi:hypothetical protein
MSIIQMRRDTAADWTSTDPTMSDGEMGFESDTNRFKIGDGATAWTSLAYVHPGAAYCELLPISASHSSNSWKMITFTETADTDNFFGFNTSRIAAPWTGLYYLTCKIKYSSESTFFWSTNINLNRAGSATASHDFPRLEREQSYDFITASQTALMSGFMSLTAGDYIEIHVFHFGATRTIQTASGVTFTFVGLS